MSQCKTCKAEIIWIKTPAGKSDLVDAKPQQVWVMEGRTSWKLVNGYTSHFATCPQASQHRRKG